MPGQLRIDAPIVVTAGRPFDAVVHIAGGQPGDTVTVRLRQTAGTRPPLDTTATATVDFHGGGTARFDRLVLAGPCRARLVADDIVSVEPMDQDDAHVEVVS